MIGPIDDVLQRLLAQSGAIAAVVWIQRSDPATATALTSCPAGLIAAGYDGSAREDIVTDLVQHNPAHLAVAVPPALRVHLPQTPTAAQTFQLGGSNLFLILIWGERSTTGGVDRPTRHLIDHDVSRLALLAELSRSDHDDAERMRAMLDHLDEGVVAVNPVLGRADINPAAAKFLGLAPGRVPVAAFAEAMARFIGRATNRSDSAEANRHQGAGTESPVESTWRFTEQPTHVRVRAHPLAGGTDGGRIWEFADVSAIEAAREESEHSRAVTKAANDALLDPMVTLTPVRDGSGRIVDLAYSLVNEATVEYLGTPREELLGRGVGELMPGLKAELLEGYIRCLQTGEPLVLNDFSYDNEILEDTRRYDIRASRADSNSIVLTWRDVTDRFETAQQILKSEEHLRLITENVGSVVSRVGPDGRYLWVSGSVKDILGAPPEHYIGRKVWELVAPDDMANDAARVQTLARGEPFNGRARLLDADAAPHWVQLVAKPFVDAAGNSDGFVATFSVIDDQVAAEQRAAQAEERHRAEIEDERALLRASADSMLDPQVLLEAIRDSAGRLTDFRFVSVNQACCKYLEVTQDELIGHSVADSRVLDIESSGLLGRYAQCLETGQPVILDDFAFINEMLDAARRYDIRATRAGADLISLTWSDVTERYQAARRLEQAHELQRASTDAMLDPQCLVEAMTDPAGTVVDLIFRNANQAYCDYIGASRSDLIDRSMLALFPNLVSSGLMALYARCAMTGEPVELEDFAYDFDPVGEERRFDIRVAQVRPGLITGTIRDTTERFRAAQRLANSEEQYRLLAENSSDVIIHGRDGKVVWASPSVGEVLGGTPEYWIDRSLKAVVPPDQEAEFDARQQALAEGHAVQQRTQLVALDGTRRWIHVHSKPFYDSDGRRDGFTASLRPIDDEVRAEQQLDEARKQQARADERYRRSMEDAAVGMALNNAEGDFIETNPALTAFFGYDRATLLGMTWLQLTAPGDLEPDLRAAEEMRAGRLDSYRRTKQFIHADGRPLWGDLSVSCTRDTAGDVEQFISQITDVTAAVRAEASNAALNQQLTEELHSAAAYMESIMPSGLTGDVEVSSRYLPSRELGGDCFDYTWIDDDHLTVYLIDVSGHGIEPALLAVSLQNLLRSGTFATGILLDPAAVLTELNRLFPMEQQNDHYFTLWYVVYQNSTRTLRYSSAGTPPAYAFGPASEDRVTTELATRSRPIGLFPDSEFTTNSHQLAAGERILIYSDGASELRLTAGDIMTQNEFRELVTDVAGSPDWSLDDLIAKLRDRSQDGMFADDLSLIQLVID